MAISDCPECREGDTQAATLDEREIMVSHRESDALDRDCKLDARSEELDERESELDERDSNLDDRESSLDERDCDLDYRGSDLGSKESELDERDSELSSRDNDLDDRDSELVARSDELDEREAELDEREAELDERQKRFDDQYKPICTVSTPTGSIPMYFWEVLIARQGDPKVTQASDGYLHAKNTVPELLFKSDPTPAPSRETAIAIVMAALPADVAKKITDPSTLMISAHKFGDQSY